MADLEAKVLIDMAEDMAESFRAELSPRRPRPRVADPFDVVRAGNHCLDKVRRRPEGLTRRQPHRPAAFYVPQ